MLKGIVFRTRSHAPRGNAISRGSASRAARQFHGAAWLFAIGVVATFVWTLFLPRIGNDPSIRESIDRREALGVNADAIFYTELEAMETLRVEWNAE